MASRADQVGLDHFGLSPDRILESGFAKFSKQHPEFRFLIKWDFYKMPDRHFDNPQAVKILSELRKLWPRLSENSRSLYLETAEAIAEAEAAKGEWNPKARRSRHKRLCKIVVKAAQLVSEISSVFPQPWTDERAPIQTLVEGLVSLVSGSISASAAAEFPIDRTVKAKVAGSFLRKMKPLMTKRARGMRWELLRDLVWLASGTKILCDERTIRRYLGDQSGGLKPKVLLATFLRSNMDLLKQVFKLAEAPEREGFLQAAAQYLTTAAVSGTSKTTAAR